MAEVFEPVKNCFVFMMISFSSFHKSDHKLITTPHKTSS